MGFYSPLLRMFEPCCRPPTLKFRDSRSETLTVFWLSLPERTQGDESDLPFPLRQDGFSRERNFPKNPRLVPDGELAEAAEFHCEFVGSEVVEKGALRHEITVLTITSASFFVGSIKTC
jgi:hypothetical protein